MEKEQQTPETTRGGEGEQEPMETEVEVEQGKEQEEEGIKEPQKSDVAESQSDEGGGGEETSEFSNADFENMSKKDLISETRKYQNMLVDVILENNKQQQQERERGVEEEEANINVSAAAKKSSPSNNNNNKKGGGTKGKEQKSNSKAEQSEGEEETETSLNKIFVIADALGKKGIDFLPEKTRETVRETCSKNPAMLQVLQQSALMMSAASKNTSVLTAQYNNAMEGAKAELDENKQMLEQERKKRLDLERSISNLKVIQSAAGKYASRDSRLAAPSSRGSGEGNGNGNNNKKQTKIDTTTKDQKEKGIKLNQASKGRNNASNTTKQNDRGEEEEMERSTTTMRRPQQQGTKRPNESYNNNNNTLIKTSVASSSNKKPRTQSLRYDEEEQQDDYEGEDMMQDVEGNEEERVEERSSNRNGNPRSHMGSAVPPVNSAASGNNRQQQNNTTRNKPPSDPVQKIREEIDQSIRYGEGLRKFGDQLNCAGTTEQWVQQYVNSQRQLSVSCASYPNGNKKEGDTLISLSIASKQNLLTKEESERRDSECPITARTWAPDFFKSLISS